MNLNNNLANRSNNQCELCGENNLLLRFYLVPPKVDDSDENVVVVCSECESNIIDPKDVNHWRCLSGSIWSETPAVQALSHKILNTLKSNDWAQEILDSVYLNEDILQWSNAELEIAANQVIHKDAFGNILETGDTVVLIQNLNVKGTNYIAPKGTLVRKIRLVEDQADQIEGKINGDTIVILAKFVKKGS